MKEKIKRILKQVIITGKTYTEYIEALADHLIANGVTLVSNDNLCIACGAVIPEGLQVCPICENDRI